MLKINVKSNYLAKIVKLEAGEKHPNADRLKTFKVDFQNCITDLSYNDGDICVYFPIGSQLNGYLISYFNGFQDKNLNDDTSIKGYMNSKKIVKATRLRGLRSEGLLIKWETFVNWLGEYNITGLVPEINLEFDYCNDIEVCKKYIVPTNNSGLKKGDKAVKISRLVEDQFRLHVDTENLRKNIFKISPEDIIGLHWKKHGTSWVVGNILTKRKLKWYERLLQKIGLDINSTQYDLIYSSRRVIKNPNY